MAISRPLQRTATGIDFTVLGYTGILGSPMLAFGFLATDAGYLQLGDGLMLSFLLAWMASMIALRGTGALGSGRWASLGSGLHLTTLAIAIVWQATQAYHHDLGKGTALFLIGDLCWPISVNGMTLIGIGTITAKRWQGWHRFAPLACGLCFPLSMAAQAIHPAGGTAFGVLTAYTWSALGLAALQEARRRQAEEPNASSLR